MAVDAPNLADLLETFRQWMNDNPGEDPQVFADQYGCTLEDLADGWNTYFTQVADFSRDYDIDTNQGGTQTVNFAPAAAPPPGASAAEYKQYLTQEVNNYQQYTTVNNIEDNSINQQIFAGGDVNQDFDIDNSDNTVGEDGILVRDSTVNGPLNTGDRAVQQTGDNNAANTGDIETGDGSPVAVGGDANSVGSGNDFGAGSQGAVNAAQGDGNKQANQQQDNDTTIGDIDTSGGAGTGGAATGGAGGAGGTGGDGGAGGAGGDDDFPFDDDGGAGGAGGGGGAAGGGAGGAATGGAGTGGDGGNVEDVVDNDQNIDFGA